MIATTTLAALIDGNPIAAHHVEQTFDTLGGLAEPHDHMSAMYITPQDALRYGIHPSIYAALFLFPGVMSADSKEDRERILSTPIPEVYTRADVVEAVHGIFVKTEDGYEDDEERGARAAAMIIGAVTRGV